MRIVCPSCQATYEVPDTLLAKAPPRVRCARCAHEWVPEELTSAAPAAPPPPPPRTPFADAVAQVSVPEPPPTPKSPELPPTPVPPAPPRPAMPDPALTMRPLPRTHHHPVRQASGPGPVMALLAWVASLAVIGAAVWFAYTHQPDIVAAFPPAERVYQALGLR